ncbi:hypothetical protein FHX44_112362 [Pseudonocardia hierapolitana]|uniref:Small secreted domain DUF320 n=1 Tax=Pseudonocardia hierapolitana TaxID=1128676 RepID=A0A561SNP8_9PSEU|nr:hypothetical protein [Pseudonocardia hierapolitana]TWF76472.1 hypothetical protein FHX44_112362 [Pseudonocardia hierapolitana]
MLKKAGIVVAAAAAGLLAVSPLAFAGDKDDHDGHGNGHGHHGKTKVEDVNSIDGSNEGLINVAGNNIAVPVNVCDNQVPVNVLGVQVPLNDTSVLADLTGALGLGLLGNADTEAESDGDNTIDDSCTAAAESGDSAEIDD